MIVCVLPVLPILLLPKLASKDFKPVVKYVISPVLSNVYIFGMEGWLANKLSGAKVKQT